MKVSMMALSRTGRDTGEKLRKKLEEMGMEVSFAKKSKYIPDSTELSLDEWTAGEFYKTDVMIWVCACGIAVRHIAPYLKSKKTDPAVIVMDECGKFVISLVSGHLGGANELTLKIAELTGSIPVVTTATDMHNLFAVDVFSRKNKCEIRNMTAAKEVSAALLAGKNVGFYSEFPWEGELPKGLVLCDKNGQQITNPGNSPEIGIAVTIYRGTKPFSSTVTIIPKTVVLGMGCRRAKEPEGIFKAAQEVLSKNQIYLDAIDKIVSIDLKKEEQGLLALSEKWHVPFETYSEEELLNVPGDFTPSVFVKSITGVDNVCERSAVLGSNYGELIQKKNGKDGVTTALAKCNRRLRFE